MRKIIFLFIAVLFIILAPVKAQYQGPTQSLNIAIDKLIGQPTDDNKGGIDYTYVDNISINDHIFSPLNYLFFKVKIKNNSNIDLNNVVVYDTKPDYIELYSDPGVYNSDNKILTISVGTLKVNEEKQYIIRGRVLPADKLPDGNKITCPINKVRVESDSVSAEDTSQFCVQNKTTTPVTTPVTTATPVKKIPKTGAQTTLLFLLGSGAFAGLGFKLRKTGRN